MAVQKKYNKESAEQVILRSFGLEMPKYLEWCQEAGFEATWYKTPWQIAREASIYKADKAIKALEKSSHTPRNEREAIHRVLQDPTKSCEFSSVSNALFDHRSVLDEDTKRSLIKLVDSVSGKGNDRSKILKDTQAIRMLIKIARWSPYWIKDPTTWVVKSHSLQRQISSLLRHLFTKYPIPTFMDSVWEADEQLHQEWYIHIGNGNNIRTARNLPFPLTKKMAHHFLEAPGYFSVIDALLHGQVVALGGDTRISSRLRGTRMQRFDDEFRQSFIKFLIANPMLDSNQYGPIIDYICHIKYEIRNEYDDRGNIVTQNPEQPNFSMNGRNANTLMDQVERWHKELGKAKKGASSWSHSVVSDFRLEEGTGQNRRVWIIKELLTSKELYDEGRAMKHCVASYTWACSSGRSSIWSLRLFDKEGSWRMVTMELTKGQICQARGMSNRSPTPQEQRIMRAWADQNKITISSYLF
jgi:hypothetical protein